MRKQTEDVKVAVIQTAPVLFNKQATLEKALGLIKQVAEQGAQLVVFPEAFIPAYPRGLGFGTIVGERLPEGREMWARYFSQSVEVPGPETYELSQIAKKYQLYLGMGISESDQRGTLYCTYLIFNSDGRLISHHRKIKPTGFERVIWGEGDGSSIKVHQTEIGRIGTLICWENYMPLARMRLFEQGVQIYLAPTADNRDAWQCTLRHIACEGRCFVIGCNQHVTKSMYPKDILSSGELEKWPEEICPGGSAIVSPMGEYVVKPVWGERVIFADLDLAEIIHGKFDLDISGHYSRKDIFKTT